ncbi:MAG TPA: DUF4157 domain-containing protein, partial [Polyangiaceae bacterium]
GGAATWAALKVLQTKLEVGAPNDRFEQEADRVAEQVMRQAAPVEKQLAVNESTGSLMHGSAPVQRACASCGEDETVRMKATAEASGTGLGPARQASTHNAPRPISSDLERKFHGARDGGESLTPAVRAFMEPRFGRDFSGVRIHRSPVADELARSLGARAFTVGSNVFFRSRDWQPGTEHGHRLIAHELAHVIQQRTCLQPYIARKWDKSDECADAPKDFWIKRIVVNQEGNQTATLHWSDGSTDSATVSTGKGHCCVDPAFDSDGVTCTASTSRQTNTNCTPVSNGSGYPVQSRVADHKGIEFWTEFVPSRGIALHTYRPVTGAPLSHGCVRMDREFAKKTFCGVRQFQTMVKVEGLARPLCSDSNVQQEWRNDFNRAAADIPDGDPSEANAIREARSEVRKALGRPVTQEQIKELKVPDDIPRCGRKRT